MSKIRMTITFSATVAVLFCSNSFAASNLTGCAAKKDEITKQIAAAKTHGNTSRVSGLTTALQEVNDHCTDELLLRGRQDKVAEKQRKVSERVEELKDAQNSGRDDKIAKKQSKLDAAKQELVEAQAELAK